MTIKQLYIELDELRKILTHLKLGRGETNSDVTEFNKIKTALHHYTITANYLLADIASPNDDHFTLDNPTNLIVRVNEFNVGYIKTKRKVSLASSTTLTRGQARELKLLAQELSTKALGVILNPNLTDYVGTNNKFDYESIIEYLTSVNDYLKSVQRLLSGEMK